MPDGQNFAQRLEGILTSVLAAKQIPPPQPDPQTKVDPSRHLSTQEALMEAADKGFVPKGFQGTPEQFKQALAQAYLQTYAENAPNSAPNPDGEARDYRQGHVGWGLEWARRQAGLRQTDPTWNMSPQEKAQYLQTHPDVAQELASPQIPITKFQQGH